MPVSPDDCAVVAGSASKSEWLLPWWLDCLREHNSCRVVLVDFGMSPGARAWAGEKVELVGLPDADRGRFTRAWFYKPYCFRYCDSPRTLYLDLDCEVRVDLAPVFAMVASSRLLMGVDGNPLRQYREMFDPARFFNAGVIGADPANPLLEEWISEVELTWQQHRSDQEILNSLLYRSPHEVSLLPGRYNCLFHHGEKPDTAIMHWTSPRGKRCARLRAADRGLTLW